VTPNNHLTPSLLGWGQAVVNVRFAPQEEGPEASIPGMRHCASWDWPNRLGFINAVGYGLGDLDTPDKEEN